MTRDVFLAAVEKYADEVSADLVEVIERRTRRTDDGVIAGPWMDVPIRARVHRTVAIPYIARQRFAAAHGLLIVPDAMSDELHVRNEG